MIILAIMVGITIYVVRNYDINRGPEIYDPADPFPRPTNESDHRR